MLEIFVIFTLILVIIGLVYEVQRLRKINVNLQPAINTSSVDLNSTAGCSPCDQLTQTQNGMDLESDKTNDCKSTHLDSTPCQDDTYEALEKKFFVEHIQGFGDHKPKNDLLLESGTLKVKPITKIGANNERIPGNFAGQSKYITKNEVNFIGTGSKNFGIKKKGPVVLTGSKKDEKSLKFHHWDGLAEKQLGGGFFHYDIGSFKIRSGTDTDEYRILSDYTTNPNIPNCQEKTSSDDWESENQVDEECKKSPITNFWESCKSNEIVENIQPKVPKEYDNQQLANGKPFVDRKLQAFLSPTQPETSGWRNCFIEDSQSSRSEKEDDGGEIIAEKRKLRTSIKRLKHEFKIQKESMDSIRRKCIQEGMYVLTYILISIVLSSKIVLFGISPK